LPRPATLRLLADALGLTGAERDSFYAAAAGAASLSTLDGESPQWTVPAQLPADVTALTGREDSLDQLDELLAPTRRGAAMVVSGTAGVGKTALALHWAHRVRRHYRDGQLYVNLRGFDPSASPSDPGDVLRGFLEALGVVAEGIPLELDARAA